MIMVRLPALGELIPERCRPNGRGSTRVPVPRSAMRTAANGFRRIYDLCNERRPMKFRLDLSLICCFALLLGGNAFAADYYVSPGGSDGNNGSQYAPWKTIQYGVNRMASGDTLNVRGGTYSESINITKARVRIRNYPGETPVIDGRETIPTDTWGALINIKAADVTVEGLQLYRSKARGVCIMPGAHRSRCSNLKISYCWRQGFAIAATSTPVADVILENSEVFRNERRKYYYENTSQRPDPTYNYNGPWGANVSIVGGLRTIIRCNKIYENYHEGLGLYNNTENALAENNEIWGNTILQVYISSSKFCTLRNNIIYGSLNWNSNKSALGAAAVWLGGETWAASINKDIGHRIYGNYVANSRKCLWLAGQTNAETSNSYIYNNIFVEALSDETVGSGVNIKIEQISGGTRGKGNIISNNAILQTKPKIDTLGTPDRAKFISNLWSQSPSQYARGSGDVIGSFSLAKNLSSNIVYGGSLRVQDFWLNSSSLAKDRGSWLTTVNMPSGAYNTTRITVSNAGFFHGDEKLKFQDGKITTIQSISGNTLTVSPAISVAHGTGVSLYDYTSNQPNIGPWIFSGSSASERLAAPTGLKIAE